MAGEQVAEVSVETLREDAFRQLADRHLQASYRLAFAILRNRAEAEDATHDAFVQAWRYWPSLRDTAKFEHWFDRILVNICRNRLKREKRRRAEDLFDDIATARGDPYGQALDRDLLATAIGTLSPDHQVVIALRYFRDLTVAEIADQLRVRPGTVQSRLHYAVKRLHRLLDGADAERTIR